MHDIGLLNSEDKCIMPIANKDEEKKKTHWLGLGVWLRNRLSIYLMNSIL